MNSNNCIAPAKHTPLIVNIGVHVVILFTILTLFFMFYVAKLTTKTLNGEIVENVEEGIEHSLKDAPESARNVISQISQSVDVPKLKSALSKTDPLVHMHNKWLFRSLMMTNLGMFVVVSLTVYLLMHQCGQCIPLKEILIDNGLTFSLLQ